MSAPHDRLRAYLLGTGWERLLGPDRVCEAYAHDRTEAVVRLPLHPDWADYADAMARAVDRVATATDRRPGDVRAAAGLPAATVDPPPDGREPCVTAPGWVRAAGLPTWRRGLWYRVADDGATLEVCAGRAGRDSYVRLVAGANAARAVVDLLRAALETATFALETERVPPPPSPEPAAAPAPDRIGLRALARAYRQRGPLARCACGRAHVPAPWRPGCCPRCAAHREETR